MCQGSALKFPLLIHAACLGSACRVGVLPGHDAHFCVERFCERCDCVELRIHFRSEKASKRGRVLADAAGEVCLAETHLDPEIIELVHDGIHLLDLSSSAFVFSPELRIPHPFRPPSIVVAGVEGGHEIPLSGG
jgi:hypothetical protein